MSILALRARDVMAAHPCVVDGALTLADAADRMRVDNLRHLLVVSGLELVGVLRTCDVDLAIALAREGDGAIVGLPLMRPVPHCKADDPLPSVVGVVQQSTTGCAVVYERGDLVGVVTHAELVHVLRELLDPTDPPHLASRNRVATAARPMVTHGPHARDIGP